MNEAVTPSEETYPVFQQAFDAFNRELFEGALPPVLLTLQRKANTCGYLSADRFANQSGGLAHELALNPEWFAVSPLVEVLQTLVHEMVHLWQKAYGTPSRGRFHNREWADKMESIGLMPSSTGQPGGRRTGDCMSDYPIAGGRFLQVVDRLVKDGFSIAWYDRFAPARSQPSSLPPNDAAGGLPAAATELPVAKGVVVIERPAARATNSSNRLKYSCACGVNVWGKPGLAITCNRCEAEVEVQDAVTI